MVIAVLALVFAVGLVLLGVGMNGRRVGDEPRCTACSYELTGLTSNRCPECGGWIGRSTVAYGMQRRRRGALVTSLALLVISGSGIGVFALGEARQVDWTRYYPLFWLMHNVRQDDAASIEELKRRAQLEKLSPSAVRRLIDTAMAERSKVDRESPPPIWADVLTLLDKRGLLDPAEQKAFYADLAHVGFAVRELVRVGDPVVISFYHFDRGTPSDVFTLRIDVKDFQFGGEPLLLPLTMEGDQSLFGHATDLWPEEVQLPTFKSGRLDVSGTVYEAIFAPSADPGRDKPLFESEKRYEYAVSVSSRDEPDPIEMIPSHSLEAELMQSIVADEAKLYCEEFLFVRRCALLMWFYLYEPVSIDLAFDVMIMSDEGETYIGQIAWAAGESGWAAMWRHSLREPKGATVRPILRGSRDAAARTVDCYRVWDGTLTLGPVALERQD